MINVLKYLTSKYFCSRFLALKRSSPLELHTWQPLGWEVNNVIIITINGLWPIKSMAKILITMAITDQIQGQNHHHNDHDQSNSRPTSSSWPCFLWPTWSSCQWPIYQYHDHHVDDQYTNINIIIRVDKYQYHLWPIYQHHYYHQGWPIYHYHHQGWRTQQQQLITCILMPWPTTPSGEQSWSWSS